MISSVLTRYRTLKPASLVLQAGKWGSGVYYEPLSLEHTALPRCAAVTQGTKLCRSQKPDALVANATPRLLLLGVVHDIGVVDRRLPLRDLSRLALPLWLHVLCLRHTRQPVTHCITHRTAVQLARVDLPIIADSDNERMD